MSADTAQSETLPAWKPVVFGALAGGMGWGIRGQYGHESGAMIAGLLLGLTLVLLTCPRAPAFPALRAVAWCAIAIGFGGSMTYGQTVGLTHDPALVGNGEALRWGLIGLSLKGALWIGFAGVFLGMGLGGVRYRTSEIALLLTALLGLCWLGLHTFNRPFDPAHHVLPRFYFSADWRFRPGAELKPRPEVWGAYLFAFLGLLGYCGRVRGDRLALHLGLWAALGGALGFPLGQCLQAYHAWNLPDFAQGWPARLDAVMNWWNWMETTFGAVMGGTLGLGLWLNRQRIRLHQEALPEPLGYALELPLLTLHMLLLVAVEFGSLRFVDRIYDFGLLFGFLPILLVTAGRLSPYAFLLPLVALPITGKTVRNLVHEEHLLTPVTGWILLLVIPLAAAILLVARLRRQLASQPRPASEVLAPVLLLSTWLFWALNFGFFHAPWPWKPWTVRTPNALAFTICALGLTAMAVGSRRAAALRQP